MHQEIKIQDLMAILKSYKNIVVSMAAAEPKSFLNHLHQIHHDINILNCLPIENAYQNIENKSNIHFDSLFFSAHMRKLSASGHETSYIPSHLHAAGVNRMIVNPPDVFIGTGAKHPNETLISLSLSNVYEMEAFKRATIKVIELNQNMPYVHGDHIVKETEIDYTIHVDYYPSELKYETVDERDTKIGMFIAELIEDNSTLQFGIGAIPNAVAHALKGKKNLGIHTEMLSDGLVQLIKEGIVNGSEKTIFKNKHVCSFILGTKDLYDYVNHNEDIVIMDANYVNDPYVIGQNHQQISINTTIEIDLTGQCNSESLNYQHYSGTGGQSDTAVGAQRSKNGKSFIALHSTTYKKDREGNKVLISKIVPKFQNGESVTLSRNDIDYVATEYGVVKLKGYTIKERILKLISIAHPSFRDSLYEEAKKIYNI